MSLLDIPMLTRLKMLRIEKTYLVLVSLLMIILWLGLVRNKNLYLYQLSKLNIARSCCTQHLWMKRMLKDYRIEQGTMNIHCDNSSAINISKNLVLHSRTKHIEIPHHFIRDLVKKKSCFSRVCPH